jgi:acetyltransferase-like isoleucine patch superfamily enzyme
MTTVYQRAGALIFNERLLACWLTFAQAVLVRQLDRAWCIYWRRRIPQMAATAEIRGRISVANPERLVIGDYARIGKNCFLFCTGGLSIGANTQISRNVVIYTANHSYNSDAIPYNDSYDCKSVSIGHSVWIGMNACVTPGVTIGDGAIVGMGTVVSQDVPQGAVVVGAQARIVSTRDSRRFQELTETGRFFGRLWPDA